MRNVAFEFGDKSRGHWAWIFSHRILTIEVGVRSAGAGREKHDERQSFIEIVVEGGYRYRESWFGSFAEPEVTDAHRDRRLTEIMEGMQGVPTL